MNNLCRLLMIGYVLTIFSCTDHKEPFFETKYVYKSTLSNKVSIEMYRKNNEKKTYNIIDSLVIPQSSQNYTFGPEYCDSIKIVFDNIKAVTFKGNDNNPTVWPFNATNSSAYKKTEYIDGNLSTTIYTYTIDSKIYQLAK